MSRLILTPMEYRQRRFLTAALEKNGRICQLNLVDSTKRCILGNIYIGKVKNIVKNIHAAFIEIADGVMCYYSMEEKGEVVFTNPKKDRIMKIGDEVLVQVCKEGIKTKLPCVTGNLNFTGRYLVLTSQRKELGFSGKLSKDEKKRLKTLLEPHLPGHAGLIVRTNAKDAQEDKILRELEDLTLRYASIVEKAASRVCFSLLEETMPAYLQMLQNSYLHDLDEIVTDDKVLYHQIRQYLNQYASKNTLLRLYEDTLLPLYKLYSLETVLEHALSEKVWLKSGGFLVIQQTEAFVCIDVNTGKFSEKKGLQDTFRKINLEAAREIAQQIRLRNLSGIILIDFINMEREEDEKELMSSLQSYLNQDSVKGTVVDMTPLKIVEVTRKKIKKSLQEEFKELFG